ncbi:MAG: phage tail family protein [Eggerthellaceae bacterium]|nr:phage tail family protein [Eggerthellaceae bacterium]
MACFIFGSIELTERFEVKGIEMPAIASSTVDVRSVPGMDGGVLVSNDLDPLEIKVTCRLTTDTIDPREVQQAWADAVARIRRAGTQALYLTPDRFRMAVLAGETPLEYANYSATGELTFLCADPVAYGREREITVPSGGSVTFHVDGTYPTAPTIAAASAVRDGTALVWRLRLDGGAYIAVETGSASARKVDADCARRVCKVADAVKLPTLESDWIVLEPGSHTLQMDKGTGAATVTYRERWL